MIYLLDHLATAHAEFMKAVISQHTTVDVINVNLPNSPSTKQVYDTVISLYGSIRTSDIVFCPWQITANNVIDSLFEDLAEQCWVVVAAGNSNIPIDDITPARARNVHTVGCLNKSGNKATLSNYSTNPYKELRWVTGTNYHIGDKTESGTSVSAAIYSAFLAEAILSKDYSVLNKLIEQRKQISLLELQ